MASLGALKSSMSLTVILVGGVFFALIVVLIMLLVPSSGMMGIALSFVLVALFILLQWGIGPSIVRMSSRLVYLKPGENKFLETMIRDLCDKSGVPMPRLAIVKEPTPNAFVFGRSQKSCTLAVHTGLLERLNKNEVRAVMAHELGHIKHKDVVIMTIVSALPLIAFIIARSLLFSGYMGGRRDNAGALVIVGVIALGFYFITQLLVLRLSRLREYYADTYSSYLTENPRHLSSALTKITYGLSLAKKESSGMRAFYIGDDATAKKEIRQIHMNKSKYDLDGDGVIDDQELELAMEEEAKKSSWAKTNHMMSTHPPTFKRILHLRRIEREIKESGIPKNIYEYI